MVGDVRPLKLEAGAQFKEGSEFAGYLEGKGRSSPLMGTLPQQDFLLALAMDTSSPGFKKIAKKIVDASKQDPEAAKMMSGMNPLESIDKSAIAQVAYFAPNEFAASDHDPVVVGFNPLAGDFDDDGDLDARDRVALLHAVKQSAPAAATDRRMDMDQDGAITMVDFHLWTTQFISFQSPR